MALTGGLAGTGKAALLATKMWADDVNARGGVLGREAKLVYYDDQSNPSTVPGIYAKLLDVDKVDLVASGYATNMIAPAMPLVIERGARRRHRSARVLYAALCLRAHAGAGPGDRGDEKPRPETARAASARGDVRDAGRNREKFGPSGEQAVPRILFVQYQGIAGNDIEQFNRPGKQVIVSPPAFASGKFLYPYADLRR